ncbi:unnamed protein product [Rotaria socialis]|uniref:Transposase n=1 Tax=Rotaria socialis TaxID=392032 RepID=A0A817YRU2_9BILA|nr:unnamed protein product [Rotaria socialis]
MKSKEIQTTVKNEYESGDGATKIFRDLGGVVALPTIKLWIKMIKDTGSINLSYSSDRPHTVRTKNGVYNVQNDRVRTVSREEVDRQGGMHQKAKFPTKVMVGFGVCSEGLTTSVIFEDDTMNAERYIKEVLPIAHGAKPHIHHVTQEWCANPDFISKDRWPQNSPDLCPLDYSLWNELAESIGWDNITTIATMIDEIECSVKNIKKRKKFTFCT